MWHIKEHFWIVIFHWFNENFPLQLLTVPLDCLEWCRKIFTWVQDLSGVGTHTRTSLKMMTSATQMPVYQPNLTIIQILCVAEPRQTKVQRRLLTQSLGKKWGSERKPAQFWSILFQHFPITRHLIMQFNLPCCWTCRHSKLAKGPLWWTVSLMMACRQCLLHGPPHPTLKSVPNSSDSSPAAPGSA